MKHPPSGKGDESPFSCLRTDGNTPAVFLGMADSLGTVATGKIADLVLLEADPLDDIKNSERIAAVFQNGNDYDPSALDAMLAGLKRAP